MYRYAQIDDEGYVVSDSYLSGEISNNNMILLDMDFDITNKKYVGGKWVEYTPEPLQQTISDEQATMYNIQANMEYLVAMAEINQV